MSFSNKKESVINFQFTSYGKYLLSKGIFKPVLYQFGDDDVIYDNLYCNVSESQNSVQDRIKEVPTLEYHNSNGVETAVSKKYTLIRQQLAQGDDLSHDFFNSGLGTSEIGNQYNPAWNIKYLNNVKTGSILMNTTGSHQNYNIPILNTFGEYKTSVDFTEPPSPGEEFEPRVVDVGVEKVYPDGSYINIEEDFILLEFNEKNVPFIRENFEIEVFQKKNFDDNRISGSVKQIIPLKFVQVDKSKSIEERIFDINTNVDVSTVEYFFEMKIDEEIDDDILCKYVKNAKVRNTLSDRLIGNCKPKVQENENIYSIEVFEEEDCS